MVRVTEPKLAAAFAQYSHGDVVASSTHTHTKGGESTERGQIRLCLQQEVCGKAPEAVRPQEGVALHVIAVRRAEEAAASLSLVATVHAATQ